MFNIRYLWAMLVAAVLGAAFEASWQLARNTPVLRDPVWRTVLADALVAGVVTAALFWIYAALLRRTRRRDAEGAPTVAVYAAVLAPWLWHAAGAVLPSAKYAWAGALVAGLVAAPFVGKLLVIIFRRRRLATVLASVAAGGLLVFTAYTLLARTDPAPAERTNFVLITVDTTRADRIGCYGHAGASTPTLDDLARRGVKFEPARCLEPITAPSHATMMTSLYPETTGVVLNAMKLRDDVPTLAEQFRDAGYATAAFAGSSSVWARDTALDRGFDTYDDAVNPIDAYKASPLMPASLAERLSLLITDDNPAERPGNEVTDAALRWMKRHPSGPFFVWLHYFDPHDDYLPPAKYTRPGLSSRTTQLKVNERWAEGTGGPKLPDRIGALYDGEIAFMDAQIGRFLDELERGGRAGHTVVLVVGDHGEAFKEHGTKYHGFRLYGEETNVPFIVCDLGGELPRPPVPPRAVSTLDVAPTMLDLAGLPIPPGMRGRALFGPPPAAPTPAYGICMPDPMRESKHSIGRLEMLATVSEKLILHHDGTVEYFDLTSDPGEEFNVAADNEERVAALRADLERIKGTIEPAPAPRRDIDDETVDKLRALGYIK
ncbi:MAG: sulfatase [Candidatus Zixiibacteriota bacterium]|jgi:arylsulfatase A-like enzyme